MGEFGIHVCENPLDRETHTALVRGEMGNGRRARARPLSLPHGRCLPHSARCDCGAQPQTAMRRIGTEGRGVVLYMNQGRRGIGLATRFAHMLADEGCDTVEANERLGFPADKRDYRMGDADSRDLGIGRFGFSVTTQKKFAGVTGDRSVGQ